MSVRPQFSVLIPAYNAAAYVERAVRSAQSQTYPPLEIIVVDDGSSDGTSEVVEAIRPAVTLVRLENGGPSRARNHGARLAGGDWLAFLDADDSWKPGKLEKQAGLTDSATTGLINCRTTDHFGQLLPERLTFADLWKKNDIITSAAVVRKQAFDALGGFNESLRWAEDYLLWLRLATTGWEIANIREELVEYTTAEGGLTQNVEEFARGMRKCYELAGAEAGVTWEMMRSSVGTMYCGQARAAIHIRNMAAARKLAREALKFGVSMEKLTLWMTAHLPAAVLDWRRSLQQQR